MKRYRRAQVQGFTLIELVVIIVIIATVASIVVPSYSHFWERTRFQGVVRDITELFADARERAVNKDTTVSVHFDTQMQTFVLETNPLQPQKELPVAFTSGEDTTLQDKATPGSKRGYQLREGTVITAFSLGNSGAVTSSAGNLTAESLHFHSDGTNEGARVSIINENGYAATIKVFPTTGQIITEEQ